MCVRKRREATTFDGYAGTRKAATASVDPVAAMSSSSVPFLPLEAESCKVRAATVGRLPLQAEMRRRPRRRAIPSGSAPSHSPKGESTFLLPLLPGRLVTSPPVKNVRIFPAKIIGFLWWSAFSAGSLEPGSFHRREQVSAKGQPFAEAAPGAGMSPARR